MPLFTVGRIIIGLFFILAGLSKLLAPAASIGMMADVGLPLPSTLIWAVIALELIGGTVLVIGQKSKLVIATAFALALFVAMTNILFHPFWALDGLMQRLELSLFFKNIAIIGALLMIAGEAHHRKA